MKLSIILQYNNMIICNNGCWYCRMNGVNYCGIVGWMVYCGIVGFSVGMLGIMYYMGVYVINEINNIM